MLLGSAISLIVHIPYLRTTGWFIIYQTLSLFLSRRIWHARLACGTIKVMGESSIEIFATKKNEVVYISSTVHAQMN